MLATLSSSASPSRVLQGFTAVFLFAVAVSLAFLPMPAKAATFVVVNDTWKDGNDVDPLTTNYAENNGFVGNDADSDGDIESGWLQGGAGTLDPVGANGPLRGTVAATSSSWTTFFTQEETPVNLVLNGDSIKVTWTFSLTGINAANTSQGFNFALADTPSSSRYTANGSTIDGAYRGYSFRANMAPTLGNSNPFQLRKRSISSGNLLATGGNWNTILGNGATSGNDGYDPNVDYTLTWQITRTGANSLDIDAKMEGLGLDNDGTAQVVFSDTNVVGTDPIVGPFGSFSFDTFAVRPSSGGCEGCLTADTFDTKLFKVEFTTTATPPGVPGDFNNNGFVDSADYVLWREGVQPLPANEVSTVGTTDAQDYTDWRARFGNPTPGGGGGLNSAAVPEPGTIVLVLVGLFGVSLARRRP